jgi:hypothetical protein
VRRALRWIGWGFLGVVSLVALGWLLISFGSDIPKKIGTVWIDGPGDTRIRGDTWMKSSMFDDSYVHEYTQVAPDGAETPIGEGLRALDIAKARLYEHDEQAELVVLGKVFRRDHSGHWSAFKAADASFVYRYYASGITRELGDSWYSSASGITCWITDLDQYANRLVSACHFPARVSLVFRRASYDAPWVLDAEATFAKTPPPQRVHFPERVEGTLTTVRIEPAAAATALLAESRRLEPALAAAGTRIAAQVEFELVGTEHTDLSLVTEGYENRWRVRGGWVDSRGRAVVFWADHPLGRSEGFAERRGQPWEEAWLLERVHRYKEDASYLIYLELRAR